MTLLEFMAAVQLLCGFHQHDFVGNRETKIACMENYVNCAITNDKSVDRKIFKQCRTKLESKREN